MPRLFSWLVAAALMVAPLYPGRSGLPAVASAEAQTLRQSKNRDISRLEQQAEVRCGDLQQTPAQTDPPTTAAVHSQFVARKHFQRAMAPAAAVRITWLGAAFSEHFVTKIEPDRGSPLLRAHIVRRATRDIEIIAELGTRHETMLGDLWCLLRLQSRGEAGLLRTDAKPNILYIRSASGPLFTIDALWGGAGWELGASTTEGFRTQGALVISR